MTANFRSVGLTSFVVVHLLLSSCVSSNRGTSPPASPVPATPQADSIDPTSPWTVTIAQPPYQRAIPPLDPAWDARIPEMRFQAEPAAAVFERVAKQTGLQFDINWDALESVGIRQTDPVTSRFRDVPAKKVIRILLNDLARKRAVLVALPRENRVFISTKEDADLRSIRTATHNIRGFIRPEIDDAGFDRRAERQQDISQLIALVKQNVGMGTWKDDGGTIGTISESNGMLTVTTTADVQDKIDELLSTLRKQRGLTIDINMQLLTIDADRVPRPLATLLQSGPDAKSPAVAYLNRREVTELTKAGQTFATPHIELRGEQRASLQSIRRHQYVADYQPPAGATTRPTPTYSSVTSGVSIDVQNWVTRGPDGAILVVSTTITDLVGFTDVSYASLPGHDGLVAQQPQIVELTVVATVNVVHGATAIVSGFDANLPASGKRRYLLVKPVISGWLVRATTP
jgi:hypothetical protein